MLRGSHRTGGSGPEGQASGEDSSARGRRGAAAAGGAAEGSSTAEEGAEESRADTIEGESTTASGKSSDGHGGEKATAAIGKSAKQPACMVNAIHLSWEIDNFTELRNLVGKKKCHTTETKLDPNENKWRLT